MNIDRIVIGYVEAALWSTHNELFDTSLCDNCAERVKKLSKGWGSPYTEELGGCQGDPQGQHDVLNPETHSEMLDGDYGPEDVADETMAEMRGDCIAFLREAEEKHGAELERADITSDQFGHDFWLTRNHHGAGFWDRGLGKLGDDLTKIAQTRGEVSLSVSTTDWKVRSD